MSKEDEAVKNTKGEDDGGKFVGKDKLIVFIGAISDLRIFTLSGSSLRLILEDSLEDFKVRVKLGLIALLFALEGFLDLSLLVQKFVLTKKFTHRIFSFEIYWI